MASYVSQGDNTQREILRALQDLNNDMKKLRQHNPNQHHNPYNNYQRNYRRQDHNYQHQHRKTPDEAGLKRHNISKYCWTHGACSHDSRECPGKAAGHQSSATFDKMMKGICERFQ